MIFLWKLGHCENYPPILVAWYVLFFMKKYFMRFMQNHPRTNFPIICILAIRKNFVVFCRIFLKNLANFLHIYNLPKISATLRLEVFICNLEVKLWSNTKTANMSLTQWTLQMFLWFWNNNSSILNGEKWEFSFTQNVLSWNHFT